MWQNFENDGSSSTSNKLDVNDQAFSTP